MTLFSEVIRHGYDFTAIKIRAMLVLLLIMIIYHPELHVKALPLPRNVVFKVSILIFPDIANRAEVT